MNSPVPSTIVNPSDGGQQQNPNYRPNTPATRNTPTPILSSKTIDFALIFTGLNEDIQQTEHFKNAYCDIILDMIPPLVQYQPPQPSRVGVIPTSMKRSPIVLPPMHEPATLTRKLEPPTNTKNDPKTDKSVFSGPHYLPEKYSVKQVKAFRQTYFVPNYDEEEEQPSRYYVNPNINQYFQAALQDGSYFESYTNYDPSDPVNFRHAYSMEQPQNTLDATAAAVKQSNQPPKQRKMNTKHAESFSSATSRKPSQQVSQKPPPPRKWHKPVVSLSASNSIATTTTDDEDEDDDEDEGTDSDNVSFAFTTTPTIQNKGKERAEAMIIDTTPQPTTLQPSQKRKSAIIPSQPASTHQQTENSISKKRKPNNIIIPSKRVAIEELRQLGKFVKIWKQKDAEVCVVCFEDVTTQSNPIIYCDNALCEAIVHKNCYKITKNIGKNENWYCDRCKPVNGKSIYRPVTCAVCPSTTGAFCKLAEPFHGIGWIHMICGKVLTGPGGFTYQPKTHDYRMLIRHHIPIQRFTSKCIYCQDSLFAEFGAKVKCHYCTKSFHVTCAEKYGYWCFNADAILACSDHSIQTTNKTSPKRLALAFERWVAKRDTFYEEQFDKTPKMFIIDAWKEVLENGGGVQQQEMDAMDKTYATFFNRIRNVRDNPLKKKYSAYLDNLMDEFCRSYTSSSLLTVTGLFLKKNFYHGDVYAYEPSKGAFSMCDDSDEDDEVIQQSFSSSASSSRSSSESAVNKRKKSASVTPASSRSSTAPTGKLFVYSSSAASPLSKAIPTAKNDNDIGTEVASSQQKQKKSNEEIVVIPSPDLICFICNQHEFPQSTWESFNFGSDYLKHLEDTQSHRKVGHTGTGNAWDPRVFIQCSECHLKVHCGCPSPPIKKYPQKFQSFVCIHCDTKGEESVSSVTKADDLNRRRGTTGINYKV